MDRSVQCCFDFCIAGPILRLNLAVRVACLSAMHEKINYPADSGK